MSEPQITDPEVDIIVIADDIRGTSGFAVNGRLVSWALSEKWTVANASPQADDRTVETIRGRDIVVLPAKSVQTKGVGSAQFAKGNMQDIINSCNPEVVVSVVDLQMISYLGNIKQPQEMTIRMRQPGEDVDPEDVLTRVEDAVTGQNFRDKFDWVAQIPIDGKNLPQEWGETLRDIDYPVSMAEFGREQIADSFGIDTDIIGHAVDYREVQDMDLPAFYVGSVNRNQFRKRMPRMIKAWSEFYEQVGRPSDARFYLHAQPNDQAGWNLDTYFERYGLEEARIPYQGRVDREELMGIYNRMDVFTSSTGGEGFGLTAVEAMSQETPVLITDASTTGELITEGEPKPRGHAIEVETEYEAHPMFGGVTRCLIDTSDMVDALVEYYENRELVEEHGRNARQFVEEHYSWQRIADEWVDYIENEVGL